MADAAAVSASLVGCFDASKFSAKPFRHWLLSDILPVAVCDAIDALPVRPPKIEDTEGKRETHNSSRLFFGSTIAAVIRCARRSPPASSRPPRSSASNDCATSSCARRATCASSIASTPTASGSSRTPTSAPSCSRCWSTFRPSRAARRGAPTFSTPISTSSPSRPTRATAGSIFVPGGDTWHGFHRRPINGVRRSLIINYVKPEWRSRHELAYPDRAAGA